MVQKSSLTVLFVVIVSLSVASITYALDKTSTGFYWPIGESDFDQASGGWMEQDGEDGRSGNYFSGLYHIGVDMMTRETDPNKESSHVYAIADGRIFYKHCSDKSWGPGNCALFIKHTTNTGEIFTGLYGHIRTSLKQGDEVYAGKLIGTTGLWDGGVHLHFAIRYGSSIQPSPWGRLPNSEWPNTNGFVDPINFLNTHYPSNDSSYFYVSEGYTHIAWSPSNVPCNKAKVWSYNQTCSAQNSHPEICNTAYNRLLQENYYEYSKDKYNIMFFGSIEDFQQFCH